MNKQKKSGIVYNQLMYQKRRRAKCRIKSCAKKLQKLKENCESLTKKSKVKYIRAERDIICYVISDDEKWQKLDVFASKLVHNMDGICKVFEKIQDNLSRLYNCNEMK